MNRFSKPDVATVLSVLALFVALGGSAYAAAKISGRAIKDNSLSGKDIRDRSLGAKELRAGALKAGPPGPTGPAGPRGPQGEPGIARAIQRFGPRTDLTGSGQTIVTATLPAGSWAVTGTGMLNNGDSANAAKGADCRLRVGTETLAKTGNMSLDADINGAARSDTEQFTITGLASVDAGGTLALVCNRAGGAGTAIEDPTLTAIEVGSVNFESGD